jgi:hypothetical protein
VALVRTDVSEEPGASIIRVTKIGELGTTQAATSYRRTLRRNTLVQVMKIGHSVRLKIAKVFIDHPKTTCFMFYLFKSLTLK